MTTEPVTTEQPDAVLPAESREALAEEMLRTGNIAPEPAIEAAGRIIHRGDADVPVPLTTTETASAGWVFVWHTQTGERHSVNRNMLPTQMKKKRDDGAWAFTMIDPKIPQIKGSRKCFLHADDPNRAEYDKLGYPVCIAAHLPNEYQRDQHMKRRHPSVWNALERDRLQREKEEDRRFQRELLQGVVGQRAPVPEPVAIPVTVTGDEVGDEVGDVLATTHAANHEMPVDSQVSLTPSPTRSPFACEHCDWQPRKNAERPRQALTMHTRNQHGG